MLSVFERVPTHPPTDAVEVGIKYAEDKAAEKIDLTYGAYFANDSRLWVSPLVKRVDEILARDSALNYDYGPNFGPNSYTHAAIKLLLGETNNAQVFGIQSIGGTGALQLGLSFLTTALDRKVIYSSDPGWENYEKLFLRNGFEDVRKYRYWDAKNKRLDFAGMCEDLNNAPENAVVVLQPCAQNPTGCDPTKEQWTKISKIMKARKLFPFFDLAYHGYATGNLDEDAWTVRHFKSESHEFLCAQSFSKNFGIYGSRVGNLAVVVNNPEKLATVKAHFLWLIRTNYLSPPRHGALIVSKILNTPEYFEEWKSCLRARYDRVVYLRKTLRERLEAKTKPGLWKSVTDQTGLFAFPGFSVDTVKLLIQKYHVYMPETGRINLPSLNENNMEYFVDAIVKTLEELETSICSAM